MLVPVRVLDRNLDLWVHRLGRTDNEVARDVIHQFEPEIGPASVSLGRDIRLPLGGHERKVVEDELVEVPGRNLGDLLDEFAISRVGVAERAVDEVGRLVGEGDAATYKAEKLFPDCFLF